MCLPGVFVRPVVTSKPGLGADHRGVHIVTHEVVGMFWGLPLHESRRFGVPGSDHLSRGRWDTYINQKHNVKTLQSQCNLESVQLKVMLLRWTEKSETTTE